ncbi:MAG: hypothetical protein HY075_04935 [Deltaproteobacteria bacterium]|nr:hypothetical protein [Deltaproteobacteria bacterium]
MRLIASTAAAVVFAFAFVSTGALPFGRYASAADFASQYKAAFDDFNGRAKDGSAQSCADKAAEAVKLAANDNEKFDGLVLQARCTYFVGTRLKKDDDKIRVFGDSKSLAEKAKNLLKDRAEGYYWYGVSLGRWAEANGIMKSLGERHNLRRTMETVLTKGAVVDGKNVPGKEYEAYGANRTLGRMYFRLPGMFGGDNRKSEELFREAVAKSAAYPETLNAIWFAEVLVANGKKAEARQVLDFVIQFENEPAKYNADRVAEYVDLIGDAKALRKEIGN